MNIGYCDTFCSSLNILLIQKYCRVVKDCDKWIAYRTLLSLPNGVTIAHYHCNWINLLLRNDIQLPTYQTMEILLSGKKTLPGKWRKEKFFSCIFAEEWTLGGKGKNLRRAMRTLRTVFCWNRPLQGASVELLPNCSMIRFEFMFGKEQWYCNCNVLVITETYQPPCLDICLGFWGRRDTRSAVEGRIEA